MTGPNGAPARGRGINPVTRWNLVRFLFTAAALAAAWFLFSGSIGLYSVLFGVSAALALALFSYPWFIGTHEAGRRHILPNPFFLLVYLVYLIFRIYTASFGMIADLIAGRISPRIVHFRTRMRSDMGRSVLCGSITLTPGTIAILIDDDHLIVHWLSAESGHSRFAYDRIAKPLERVLRMVWS